jgi:hypothetical protein
MGRTAVRQAPPLPESARLRASSTRYAGERSTAKRSGEGRPPNAEIVGGAPHPLAALATSPRKRGEVTEPAARLQPNSTTSAVSRPCAHPAEGLACICPCSRWAASSAAATMP